MKDRMDWLLNWSGGTWVGLSTLVMLSLAVGEFIKTGHAPAWFVDTFGLYVVLLTLYVAQKPVNQWVGSKKEGQ